MLGAAGVRRDERQIDLGLQRRRQFALGLLSRFLQSLEGHTVLAEIDAVLLLELFGDPVHHALVEIVAAQVGVTVGGLDFEHALPDLEDGDVERAAAQVVDGDRLILLLVHPIGQRGSRRLVDDAQYLEPGDLPGVLGGLTLTVVEIRRHGDDRLVHLLPQVGLGRFLQLAQDHGGDFGRRVLLAADVDPHVAVAGLDDLVRDEPDLAQDLVVAAAHEPLDREDGVLRVRDRLPLGDLADEDLAFLGEANHRRREPAAFLIRDHGGVAALHHRHDGVRRAEIDTDHLRHVHLPCLQRAGRPLDYRTSILISFGLISSAFGSRISRTPSR